jgi:hypothetical protein
MKKQRRSEGKFFGRIDTEESTAAIENPGILPAKHSNSASGYKNERILLFDLTFLPFELYLHKHHVFLASSS